MLKYFIKRLLMLVPVLIGVSIVVFVIMHVLSPDPAPVVLGQHATQEAVDEWRAIHGLDDPIFTQYIHFVKGALTGDLGNSYYTGVPVTQEISTRLPATIELSACAIIVATVFGILLGVISAMKKNTFIDNASMTLALAGISMPIFWIGILFIIFFSGTLRWLPSTGRIDPMLQPMGGTGFFLIDTLARGDWAAFVDTVKHLVMPVMTLGLYSMAIIARMTRASMLDTLDQDYVRTAHAKGLIESRVVGKHALHNAMIPVTTVVGLQFGGLLGGSVLTETVFSWPGIGSYAVNCIMTSDFPVVQGFVLLVAVIFVLVNLGVDLLYAFLDPRIKYAKKEK